MNEMFAILRIVLYVLYGVTAGSSVGEAFHETGDARKFWQMRPILFHKATGAHLLSLKESQCVPRPTQPECSPASQPAFSSIWGSPRGPKSNCMTDNVCRMTTSIRDSNIASVADAANPPHSRAVAVAVAAGLLSIKDAAVRRLRVDYCTK